jgi:flagellar hook protein FlgE
MSASWAALHCPLSRKFTEEEHAMGFEQGLSGLDAAATNLDIIGNNIANANTVGFKASQAEFADVYANALGGTTGNAVGIGVKVASVAQQFGQGNITVTSNPLDMAINGQGFFQLNDGGSMVYSRNGQFQLDQNGYIVNAQGNKLMGYAVDPKTGLISQGNIVPLQLSNQELPPQVTSTAQIGLNLNAADTPPTTTTFSPSDPTSYNNSTSMTIYDSLGVSHIVNLYFQMAPSPAVNTWNAYMTVDGLPATGTSLGTVSFDSTGALTTPASPGVVNTTITYPNGTTQNVGLNFSATTQYGSPFAVNSLTQNGYATGQLSGFSTSSDGTIVGNYTNGQTKPLGQILLANFSNAQGLQPIGNNDWSPSASSGQALLSAPGTSGLGVLQSGAVESSNVDLTGELVNLITAQRVYQANAQTIKAQDTILQTLVTGL